MWLINNFYYLVLWSPHWGRGRGEGAGYLALFWFVACTLFALPLGITGRLCSVIVAKPWYIFYLFYPIKTTFICLLPFKNPCFQNLSIFIRACFKCMCQPHKTLPYFIIVGYILSELFGSLWFVLKYNIFQTTQEGVRSLYKVIWYTFIGTQLY